MGVAHLQGKRAHPCPRTGLIRAPAPDLTSTSYLTNLPAYTYIDFLWKHAAVTLQLALSGMPMVSSNGRIDEGYGFGLFLHVGTVTFLYAGVEQKEGR